MGIFATAAVGGRSYLLLHFFAIPVYCFSSVSMLLSVCLPSHLADLSS